MLTPFFANVSLLQSSLLHSKPKSTVGTPAYIAPEVLSRREYDGKVSALIFFSLSFDFAVSFCLNKTMHRLCKPVCSVIADGSDTDCTVVDPGHEKHQLHCHAAPSQHVSALWTRLLEPIISGFGILSLGLVGREWTWPHKPATQDWRVIPISVGRFQIPTSK